MVAQHTNVPQRDQCGTIIRPLGLRWVRPQVSAMDERALGNLARPTLRPHSTHPHASAPTWDMVRY